MTNNNVTAQELAKDWETNPRWKGIERTYSAEDVIKLKPSLPMEFSLAKHGAERLWQLLNDEAYINTLGALTGSQAVQMVRAGLKAIYMSGWQVAADANMSGQTYPDQSLYPSNSVPQLVKRLNNALTRADLLNKVEDDQEINWYAPIVADAEAGFGGPLHAFELMKSMIEAGAAGVHFEDQLASEKKCGHLGGKVLVPTSQFIKTLSAARLASDVCGVPTMLIARTDSLAATLMTSDIDPQDSKFLTGDRTAEGFYRVKPGIESAIARGLSYAPYADLLWFETSVPDIGEAKEFADAIKEKYPDKMLAYNCSPSFNWEKKLDQNAIAKFQTDLAEYGYKFQFITLAGWHSINYHMYDMALNYKNVGMPAFVDLQSREFKKEADGYTATRHQREVGTGYFDKVLMTVTGGQASTTALAGSTEEEQFDSKN
jgi:isocitrate lyase